MKHSNKHQQLNQFFLPDLCNTRAVLILLVLSEALVLAMTLIESSLTNISWERFSLVSFFVLWVCLLSIAIICPLRYGLVHLSPLPVSLIAMFVIALITLMVSVVGDWFWNNQVIRIDWQWAARNIIIALIFGGMVLRYFYVSSQFRLKTQSELQARLSALQASIRPHFFFNTLNTVASLIMIDPAKAEAMLLDLSVLFRAVLNNQENLISIQDEIQFGKTYLDIEQTRLGSDRLQINWQIPKDLAAIQVPQLILQPLLENAIYHGIQPSVDNGFIEISCYLDGSHWCLAIRNSKSTGTQSAVVGHSMAQTNVRARLAMLEQGAKLIVKDAPNEYSAIIKLPQGAEQ